MARSHRSSPQRGGNPPTPGSGKRVDYREALDLSNRSLTFTTGIASIYVALTRLDLSRNSIGCTLWDSTELTRSSQCRHAPRCSDGVDDVA